MSQTTLNKPVFALLGYQKDKQEKGTEKILEEIIAENFLNVRKEIINQVQEAQSLRRKRKTPKHGHQTDKNLREC